MKRTSKPKFSFMVGVGQNTTGPKKGAPELPKPDKMPEPTDNDKSSHTIEKFRPNAPKE